MAPSSFRAKGWDPLLIVAQASRLLVVSNSEQLTYILVVDRFTAVSLLYYHQHTPPSRFGTDWR